VELAHSSNHLGDARQMAESSVALDGFGVEFSQVLKPAVIKRGQNSRKNLLWVVAHGIASPSKFQSGGGRQKDRDCPFSDA
jgi:hypothetical protein